MTDVMVVGIGQTPPVRRSNKDIRALVIEASMAAINDAGLEPADIDGMICDTMIMPTTVPQEYVASQLGIERRFSGGTSWGGAGNACALLVARDAIRTGKASVVLCYFGVDWGSRSGGPYGFHDLFPAKQAFEKPYGFLSQPSYFATWANRYMHEFGATEDDLATIAVSSRTNALLNGNGQITQPLTREDYFKSRMVSDPLRVADCCLISDGACALIVTSADRARDLRAVPVRVLGGAFASEPISVDDVFTQSSSLVRLPGVAAAATRGLQDANISLHDVDFAEIYDCFTISCLIQIEDIGFCGKGEGAALLKERDTTVHGDIPINTHGGLLAHSYLLGAEHVIEMVRQLRRECGRSQVVDADVGLYGGLSMPDYGVLILGRA